MNIKNSGEDRRVKMMKMKEDDFRSRSSLINLSLEGEGGTDLVCGLVEILGVERGAETEGHAGAELDVVCEGGDAAVVDLGLWGARGRRGVVLVILVYVLIEDV